MPRTKTKKRPTKRKIQRQTSTSSTINMQKMERDFLQAPTKLANQLSKEIHAHKQKEKKLKSAINKIKAQVKSTESKMKAASKGKTSAGSKKQFNTAKKTYDTALKTHSQLNKHLELSSTTIETLSNRHAKLIALGKHINQFEKEWGQAKKATSTTSKKTKKVGTKKSSQKNLDKNTRDNFEDEQLQDDNQTRTYSDDTSSQVEEDSTETTS